MKSQPRQIHAIPFRKKEVDKVLSGEHPFGLTLRRGRPANESGFDIMKENLEKV